MNMEFVQRLLDQAEPYSTIGPHTDPYMERVWLKKFTKDQPMSMRLHNIRRSDSDRALHDHPWENISVVLAGEMIEVVPLDQSQPCMQDPMKYSQYIRRPGDVIARKATDRHRLIIPPGQTVWTLFIMGDYEQNWGFYDPIKGIKIPYKDYLRELGVDAPPSANDGRAAIRALEKP